VAIDAHHRYEKAARENAKSIYILKIVVKPFQRTVVEFYFLPFALLSLLSWFL
jgi:hypothetical protein